MQLWERGEHRPGKNIPAPRARIALWLRKSLRVSAQRSLSPPLATGINARRVGFNYFPGAGAGDHQIIAGRALRPNQMFRFKMVTFSAATTVRAVNF